MTRAAARLHMAQPALSQAIANLESELGFQLLERHARGVTVTPAGSKFLEKARQALAAESEAANTAQSLARASQGAMELGFLGAPPGLHSPELLDAFTRAHPGAELNYHELQFPSGSTSTWLGRVDLAVVNRPPAESGLWIQPLRPEPRVVVASRTHPLSGRGELALADVLDETYIGTSPAVAPWFAGTFTFDDHRGGPPPNVTSDHASNTQELFAMIADGRAIAVMPKCHAEILIKVLPKSVMLEVTDASPAELVLAGREDHRSPLVDAFRETAASLGATD